MYIEDVWTSIEEFVWWKEEQGGDSGSGAEEEEGESDEEIEWMGRIQRQILRLWIALLNQLLQDDEYKSVLISGLAILGMREDDGWLDAEDYTPKYSAVIKLARLMVVQEAYERRREAIEQTLNLPHALPKAWQHSRCCGVLRVQEGYILRRRGC
jgi:hypothetical protein